MATVKYLLQSKSTSAPVYMRLSLGRGNTIKRKTGLVCDFKKWSKTQGLPIAKSEESKDLRTSLTKLDTFVIEHFNKDHSQGVTIDGAWLGIVIDKHFQRTEPEVLDYLTDYAEYFVQSLPYKAEKGRKGVTIGTQKKYKTILNKLLAYEKYKGKRYLLKDVDLKFRQDIIQYLVEVDKLADNTLGRYIKVIKTIVLDARKQGYGVNPQIDLLKGFGVKTPKVTLSFKELEQIKKQKVSDENLELAKDWLIIGCYTGQRVSDLMRMNSKMIQNVYGYDFIVLDQVKTSKTVQIPVHSEVLNILNKRNGEFPPTFAEKTDSNSALFNRHVKTLCRRAKINTLTEGSLFDPEKKKYESGTFEKWRLVSSHICRRSFATNFYSDRKYPTPLLMNITAHSTEKMFLEYIGKQPIDYSVQLAEIWATEAKKQSKEPQLELVRTAVNQ